MPINYDLEMIPLEISTDSTHGLTGWSKEYMMLNFYTGNYKLAGGFYLHFGQKLRYYLPNCINWTHFPTTTTLPSSPDKIWRITLIRTEDVRLVIHCNGVEVLNLPLSDTMCTANSAWSKYWKKDTVKKIKFPQSDTASDLYRSSPAGD